MVLILNTIITIGTNSVVVLPDRKGLESKRIAYVLQNISTGGQVITISTGAPSASGASRTLSVGGSEDRTPDERPPQDAMYAISDAAGGTLAVYEESE